MMIPPTIAAISSEISAHELGSAASPTELARAVEELFVRIHARVAGVVGTLGFQALMVRALHLAKTRHAWLDRVELTWGESSLAIKDLHALTAELGAEEIRAGASLLVEHLCALLARFIGEDLALRLLRREWPIDEVNTGPRGRPDSEDS